MAAVPVSPPSRAPNAADCPSAPADVVLEPVLGPPLAPIALTARKPVTLGRLPECEVQLPESEKTVSRKHCTFESRAGADAGWFLTDLGSRHGTFVNNIQIAANVPKAIKQNDTVRLGPWVFRVVAPDSKPVGMLTNDDTGTSAQLVTLAQMGRDAIDRRRLELLFQCAKEIQVAGDERALAQCVLNALLEGTGYPRVAIVRPAAGGPGAGQSGGGPSGGVQGGSGSAADAITVLATRTNSSASANFQFSRSLVAAACRGQMVQLKVDDAAMPAMSIMSVGMTTAMAVPVFLDNAVSMCFYLDARRDEKPVHEDAAAFCQAIAEMSSLSLGNMQRTRLHVERLRMAEQMEAALQIQRQILPAPRGDFLHVSYALELKPGRFVAGDLFDIIRLDDQRIAFFIGDVAGKGVPAAILMATTQSYLNAALRGCRDPAAAVRAVNAHLMTHAPEGKFVSLWAGILDVSTGSLQFCDAGHGYAMLLEPGQPARSLDADVGKGVPLRVIEEAEYQCEELFLKPGSRVVLYSDGVVEQVGSTDGSGEQPFGIERVMATLEGSTGPEDDVLRVLGAVKRHAASESLDDDLTVASVRFGRGS